MPEPALSLTREGSAAPRLWWCTCESNILVLLSLALLGCALVAKGHVGLGNLPGVSSGVGSVVGGTVATVALYAVVWMLPAAVTVVIIAVLIVRDARYGRTQQAVTAILAAGAVTSFVLLVPLT